MIISKTPFRVSLFGGGTDYTDWTIKNGGLVVGTAIDKYCYLSVNKLPPFFEHKHRIVWSKVENVQEISEIEHPMVRCVLKHLKIEEGVEISYRGDLPARSGLGTSSSFTVGLLNALHALFGRRISQSELAGEAIFVEQNIAGECVGSQDQIFAAYGDFNEIQFYPDGGFLVKSLKVPGKELLQKSMMLFFTGFSRDAAVVAYEQVKRIRSGENDSYLWKILEIAVEGRNVLQSYDDPVGAAGRLLDMSWKLKRELAEGVSLPNIDSAYEVAIGEGALGGKLLGAGGGGFLLLIVPPKDQPRIADMMRSGFGMLHVPFGFSAIGSQIIVNGG